MSVALESRHTGPGYRKAILRGRTKPNLRETEFEKVTPPSNEKLMVTAKSGMHVSDCAGALGLAHPANLRRS